MAQLPSLPRRIINRLKAGMAAVGWGSASGNSAALTWDGWIPFRWPLNYWQTGNDPLSGGWNATVYACVMLYARTIAQLPGAHKKKRPDNGADTFDNSALARVLKKPNDYQTRSDFLYNMISSLLCDGNAYALALRNNRNEVVELHWMNPRFCKPVIDDEGNIFYTIGGNEIVEEREDETMPTIDGRLLVPARDMMHVRAHCPRHPLIGESPMVAAIIPITLNTQGSVNISAYYANMSKPSGVLQTDNILSSAQVADLRARWMDQTTGANVGGVPVLSAGLKWMQTGSQMNANELQVEQMLTLSSREIAKVFGVPLALINDMTGATYHNTEHLIMTWLRQGLGFYLDRIELEFDKLFEIERNKEFTEFDISALLRPDFKTRMEGMVKAVTGGIFSPNEARATEDLPAAENGDEPRVQQQMVPLSWEPPAPAAPSPPQDANPPDANPPDAGQQMMTPDMFRAHLRARIGAPLIAG